MKLEFGVAVCLQLCVQFLAYSIQAEEIRCTASKFTVTVDNMFDLYIDGVKVSFGLPNANDWIVADTVSVPASARVIAIKGVDYGGGAGILGSGADATTDGSWKCTSKHHVGWIEVDFDDSSWKQANVIANHVISSPWRTTIPHISSDAKWIWTPNGPTSDKTVYCRKRRNCFHGTGPTCITSCKGKADGKYQSCKTCDGFVSCTNKCFQDFIRPCPIWGMLWDDKLKKCEWESSTCVNPEC